MAAGPLLLLRWRVAGETVESERGPNRQDDRGRRPTLGPSSGTVCLAHLAVRKRSGGWERGLRMALENARLPRVFPLSDRTNRGDRWI